MITQLGLGTMATRVYDLHVDMVRQFMATVELTYSTSKARVAGDRTLTFFARGIRYKISITELCRIYGFNEAAAAVRIPPFLGLDGLWEIIGTGAWNSNSATQTEIHYPTLRFRDSTSIDSNSIASIDTLITSSDADAERRERSTKKRYDEASTSIQHRDPWPRDETFAEFADPKKAEDAAERKIPPFLGLNGFWEIIGTGVWNTNSATQTDIRHPTLRYFLGALANTLVCKMEPNKVRIQELTLLFCWLKEELFWSFRIGNQHPLLPMPNMMITDFDDKIDRLRFMPDSQLLRDLPAIPHRPPGVRRARATQGPPEAPLPDFPIIPDIHMPDQGDFQRVVVDALRAILARVSCTSRRTIRAHSPEAAGPSRQHRDPSSGSDDETSEDTD
ncbi:hypothetical protein F2Q68_00005011 [Brassica cretica]|uniref:Arabidopsis retrotransposon Orf1 C-terminal domain-containing protein n=1 Tax=Brassica cretica TaxID=69181 RepID=A0A8S9JBN6_BRACR|nr:hypothetical protein F2Q68_00005011 [Brassica cretica]